MIDIFIHDQKTVVDVFILSHDYRRILGVMLCKILLQTLRQSSDTDFSRHSCLPFGQHHQHAFVYKELLNNCSWSVTTYNGVKGMTVKGQNGNSIFLPFAGDRVDDGLNYEGYDGYYAYCLGFDVDGYSCWDRTMTSLITYCISVTYMIISRADSREIIYYIADYQPFAESESFRYLQKYLKASR